MEFDVRVMVGVYRHFAETTRPPSLAEVARTVDGKPDDVRDAYARLFQKRVLVLEPDGETIRTAPPFSGIATQHRVRVEDRSYYANCAWTPSASPRRSSSRGRQCRAVSSQRSR